MKDWIPLEDLKITDDVSSLHVDTRDFHCLVTSEEGPKIDYDSSNLIGAKEIIGWLRGLKEMTMKTLVVRFEGYGWMKYLRLYRVDKDNFVVTDRNTCPVEWRGLKKEGS